MLSPSYDEKILRGIVVPIVVNVVNNFSRLKTPSKLLLGNNSVLMPAPGLYISMALAISTPVVLNLI